MERKPRTVKECLDRVYQRHQCDLLDAIAEDMERNRRNRLEKERCKAVKLEGYHLYFSVMGKPPKGI